ncbi:MAG TPA: transcriptional repressor NrdR [candidate division WWE3 bacterium]|uniref:Transcriptional repressor NrdR n=1 Tax=candidate division WWE3 bacterium TaxID=2053526 RepID=A0A7V5J2I8_UNCKA|nr:transcriptional repressor NrdR [candidate division WWE3 bacterium]
MICPYCHNLKTKVVDKRDFDNEPVSRRRRECLSCRKRFTTYERVESIDLKVVKKDGSLQEYNREKLTKGILVSVQKRLSDEEVEKIVDDIEFRLMKRKSTEVSTGDIGRMVLTRLKNRDLVSYLRFASVFLDFVDVDEFKREIKRLES